VEDGNGGRRPQTAERRRLAAVVVFGCSRRRLTAICGSSGFGGRRGPAAACRLRWRVCDGSAPSVPVARHSRASRFWRRPPTRYRRLARICWWPGWWRSWLVWWSRQRPGCRRLWPGWWPWQLRPGRWPVLVTGAVL
jgi:hypothetical protein